jgi:hypothetical protein
MHQYDGQETSGTQKEEGGVGAKHGSISELEDGAYESKPDGDIGVCHSELIEMVHMGEPEDDGDEEDDFPQ